jgi:hypothetical protein
MESHHDWTNDFDLELFTDSVQFGCGAMSGQQWAFMQWSAEWERSEIIKDITFLELVPIAMAFDIWGKKLAGKGVILHTDNQSLISIINTKTSKSKRVMHFLRKLALQGLVYSIQFKAVHITGRLNVKADSLSRQQRTRFRASFPSAEEQPTKILPSFLQVIYSVDPKS